MNKASKLVVVDKSINRVDFINGQVGTYRAIVKVKAGFVTVVDDLGIAVRTGHHCAWPLTRKMGVPATTRASFYLYNTLADIDALVDGIGDAQKYFG